MLPVSSLTVTANASVLSEIPAAARCLRPKRAGSSLRSERGSTVPAAMMVPPSTMVAPSCKGAFLKKMLSKSILLRSAFIGEPEEAKDPSGSVRLITRSAPVFVAANSTKALTIASTSALAPSSSVLSFNKFRKPWRRVKVAEPTTSKNFRISCWKTIIKMMSPAPMKEPRNSLSRRISSNWTRRYKR